MTLEQAYKIMANCQSFPATKILILEAYNTIKHAKRARHLTAAYEVEIRLQPTVNEVT